MFHGRAKILGCSQPVLASQQGSLGRKLATTLAATSSKDGTTGTSLHTQAETVGLSATTVVWLESTISHLVLLQNFVVGFKSKLLILMSPANPEQSNLLNLRQIPGLVKFFGKYYLFQKLQV